jgi:hypothetical protein
VLAVKNFFDDIMLSADCVEAALAISLTVEHGFTNIQFVALAADAMAAGDINWSNLLSSIQTDEARHAQQGFPTLQVLMAHDPERAQQIVDVAFWRATRLFQILTGPAMDYYTPLRQRKQSFKEFIVLEAERRRIEGRAEMAEREIPGLGRDLGPDVGSDHRQRQFR